LILGQLLVLERYCLGTASGASHDIVVRGAVAASPQALDIHLQFGTKAVNLEDGSFSHRLDYISMPNHMSPAYAVTGVVT
jgi:hypothetical protein